MTGKETGIAFATLAILAAGVTYFLLPEPRTGEVNTARIEEALHEHSQGTSEKIDSLALLLSDSAATIAGSLDQRRFVLNEVARIETEHGKLVDILSASAQRERAYEERMEARMVRLLCWSSRGQDVECR